jgi:iron complex outermembrane recepter protein
LILRKNVFSISGGTMGTTQRNMKLACAVTLALACAQARADEASVPRSSKTTDLEEIVVTATKRSVDVQTVPLSVTAVSGDALVARQVTNINALDEVIPGLTIHSAGFNTSAIIRGAGSAGTSDTAVPFYTDGMFMPSNGQALATFVDIDRVEGLRGPQGTLFGRNTFGGLVNIITRKPEVGKWGFGGAVTVGDYSEAKMEGMVNVPVGDTLAFRVTASRDRHDPYVRDSVNPAAGLKDANNQYVRAQLRWQPRHDFYVNFSYVDWQDDSHGSMNWGYKLLGVPLSRTNPTQLDQKNGYLDPRAGLYVGCPDGNRPGGASWAGNVCSSDPKVAAAARITGGPFEIQYDTTPVHHARAKDYYLTSALDLPGNEVKLTAARFDYKYLTFVDADFSSLSNLADGESIHSRTDQIDLTLTSTGNGKLRYTVGLYYYNRPRDENSYAYLFAGLSPSSGYAGATPSTPVWAYWLYGEKSGTQSKAVYGQADYSLTDKLILTAGARYTEDDRTTVFSNPLGFSTPRQTSAVNPTPPQFDYSGQSIRSGKEHHSDWRVSPQYQITPNTMVYVSWATAYIAGGPNADTKGLLPAQTNSTYEVGTKTTWLDNRLRLNATLYQATYDNLLTTVFTVYNGVPVAKQIPGGSARARGLELEGWWAITAGLRADFSLVANQSEYLKFNVASRTGTNGVDFIGADGRGYYRVDGNETPFSPKFTASLGLRYEIPLPSGNSITPRAQIYQNSGYQTSRDNAFFTYQPSFTKLDLSATWASEDKKFTVQGFVNNAANKVISTSTDITPVPNFQAYADYEPPRTFGVRIGYNF